MIKGLEPTLAEAGKIKIGKLGEERTSRKGAKFRLPTKLDHFLITTSKRDADGDLEWDCQLMEALPKCKDGKIREIPITLHSESIDEVFPTAYAMYGGKRLLCRGDGEKATRWKCDAKGNRLNSTTECACPCPNLEQEKCKPHGTLHCSIIVPGLAVAGSVHKWRTTSVISVRYMYGSLLQIKQACGALQGLPLWLKISPVHVTPKSGPTTVYCCHVELRANDLVEVQRQALRAARTRQALADITGGETPRLLVSPPASEWETPEEQAEIAMEFFPENIDDVPEEPNGNGETVPKTQQVLNRVKKQSQDPPAAPAQDLSPSLAEQEPWDLTTEDIELAKAFEGLMHLVCTATTTGRLKQLGSIVRETNLPGSEAEQREQLGQLRAAWLAKMDELGGNK